MKLMLFLVFVQLHFSFLLAHVELFSRIVFGFSNLRFSTHILLRKEKFSSSISFCSWHEMLGFWSWQSFSSLRFALRALKFRNFWFPNVMYVWVFRISTRVIWVDELESIFLLKFPYCVQYSFLIFAPVPLSVYLHYYQTSSDINNIF